MKTSVKKLMTKKTGTKKLGVKKTVTKKKAGTDPMAAARAARAAGGKKSARRIAKDDGMPDPKKMKVRHIKYKDEVKSKLLTTSKLVGYFKALGLRISREDILAAASDELYSTLFRAALRTVRNNRKTVRGFDIR